MVYSAWRSAGEQTITALIPGSFRMTSAQHIRRHCQFIQIYRKAGGCAACRFRRQLAGDPELLTCAALFLRRACRRNCQAPKSSERDMDRRREFCRKFIILTLISRIPTFRIWTAAFRRRGGICGPPHPMGLSPAQRRSGEPKPSGTPSVSAGKIFAAEAGGFCTF